MTFISNEVLGRDGSGSVEPFMAIVDENGRETPFNEYDIQYSLKQLSSEREDAPETLDLLMERVLAARAIA